MKDFRLMRQELLGSAGDQAEAIGVDHEGWQGALTWLGRAAIHADRFEAPGTFAWEIDPRRFRPRVPGRREPASELAERLWCTIEMQLEELTASGATTIDFVHDWSKGISVVVRIARTRYGFDVAAQMDVRSRAQLAGAWERMLGTLAGELIRFQPL